jgi:hypothetical protein
MNMHQFQLLMTSWPVIFAMSCLAALQGWDRTGLYEDAVLSGCLCFLCYSVLRKCLRG